MIKLGVPIKPIINKPIEKAKTSTPSGNDFVLVKEEIKLKPAAPIIETVSTPAEIINSTPTISTNPKVNVEVVDIVDYNPSPKTICELRGAIRKPSTGEVFAASAEIHQNHSKYYTCLDVIFMERASGRHGENCAFVGHLSAKKCCVKDKDKS